MKQTAKQYETIKFPKSLDLDVNKNRMKWFVNIVNIFHSKKKKKYQMFKLRKCAIIRKSF